MSPSTPLGINPSTALGTSKRGRPSLENLPRASNGGGGGSRTRVREQAHRGFYMLSLCILLTSERPHRQGHSPASPLVLALLLRAGEERPAHLYDAFPSPVSEARWAWLLVRQPVPVDGWQLCVSHLFYEGDGTSACFPYQPLSPSKPLRPPFGPKPPFMVHGSWFIAQKKG